MPWLKLLHICAVITWCGALLYLPVALSTVASGKQAAFECPGRIFRGIFTWVATPAALVAIASGTAIFITRGPLAPWLIAKLTTVSLLVLCHGACGMLILRVERQPESNIRGLCTAVGLAVVVWLMAIAWLVLRKPF
jgi:uncharacterized membrane protein